MFYIFHGEDQFSLAEELAGLRGKLAGGDSAMAELNTNVLDGARLTMGELRHTCDTIPFLADRRLVIVRGLLARLASRGKSQAEETAEGSGSRGEGAFVQDLAAYLPHLAPTTRLIFVEKESLSSSHPILKVARAEGQQDRAFVKLFKLPRDRELPAWIRQRAASAGGSFDGEAAALLAALVGADLGLLDQEIDKLLLYAGDRPVTVEDVHSLVSLAREASIFDLVDCVGRRETGRALRLLHRLLDDGEAPLYLLAMLARQIRILIQVSELQSSHLSAPEMAKHLKLHPYVVEKGLGQARNFDLAQLEAAHERLVQTDWAIKSGRMDDVLALDVLVVALTHIN